MTKDQLWRQIKISNLSTNIKTTNIQSNLENQGLKSQISPLDYTEKEKAKQESSFLCITETCYKIKTLLEEKKTKPWGC